MLIKVILPNGFMAILLEKSSLKDKSVESVITTGSFPVYFYRPFKTSSKVAI